MITKTECLGLLFELKDLGVECSSQIQHLLSLPEPDINTIKFINDNKELNVRKFYEKLRKSYNKKKSNLYINYIPLLLKHFPNLFLSEWKNSSQCVY